MKTTNLTFAFLILCFNLFFTAGTFSQLSNFGIKGGINISNSDFGNDLLDDKSENKTGFNAGLFYDFLNFTNVSFSAETEYSQKGFENEYITADKNGNVITSETIHSNLNYIDAAVLVKFFLETKNVNPYLSLGPVLGFYAGYSVSSSVSNDTLFSNNSILEDLKSPSLGIEAGIGAEFKKILPVSIIAEIRYNLDLTNSYTSDNVKFKNELFEFDLGIKFK